MTALAVQTSRAVIPGTTGSVIGESAARIPTCGRIRSGIKVLTAAAKKHERAQDIYDSGVAAGASFSRIEQVLKEKCQFDKSPLTPRNVPYFTVRPGDFGIPEVAGMIMDRYAEDRGEGRHLYRFPVIFPCDDIRLLMPHGLTCYTRSERVYWSEYTPDGVRMCKMHAPAARHEKSRRAVRTFGGRRTIYRPDNEGRCDPEACPEYQQRKCNLTGAFIFLIPGIPGAAAIDLPTGSYYSMQQAMATLSMVFRARNGRISGTNNGQPLFHLAKVEREVSMLDPESGEPRRRKQWLIEVEADIDLTAMIVESESAGALESSDDTAVAITQEAPPESAAYRSVCDALDAIGVPMADFAAYAAGKWGEEWSGEAESLDAAIAEINFAADNEQVDAYRNRICDPF